VIVKVGLMDIDLIPVVADDGGIVYVDSRTESRYSQLLKVIEFAVTWPGLLLTVGLLACAVPCKDVSGSVYAHRGRFWSDE
jgi:hypothetical protein